MTDHGEKPKIHTDLNARQFAALETIAQVQPVSLGLILRTINVDRVRLASTIASLEKRNLVGHSLDRGKAFYVTPAGQVTLKLHRKLWSDGLGLA